MLALWSLCFLSAFSVILGFQVRQRMVLANKLDERDKLRFIAQAGAKRGIIELAEIRENIFDCLKDQWSNNGSFKSVELADAEFSIVYNYLDPRSGYLEKRYGLVDEERKININTAGIEVMERLFRFAFSAQDMHAEELAACIVDWRDEDEQTVSLSGAESSYYNNLQVPYSSKNKAFEVLDELLLLKGMDDKAFEKLKDYVTIYGDGKVNVNTAPSPVLVALGFDEDIADKIISYRAGEDGVEGSIDDNVFTAESEIVPKISQIYHFSESEIAQITNAAGSLTVASKNFTINVAAVAKGREQLVLNCVVNRQGKVLYWHEE